MQAHACISVSASANKLESKESSSKTSPSFLYMERIAVNNAIFQQWRKYYEGFPMTEDVKKTLLNYVNLICSHIRRVLFWTQNIWQNFST